MTILAAALQNGRDVFRECHFAFDHRSFFGLQDRRSKQANCNWGEHGQLDSQSPE
jgi:hypothetical protein